MNAPLPPDEPQRLQTLRRYGILDTEPEEGFDDLTLLASHICRTPIALISLVDANRQWFKSRKGIPATETPRDVAFCAHAILERKVFLVRDAATDARFATNPLVLESPKIRFYAGAPLVTSDGHALGTICVVDHVPRDLEPEQEEALQALSRQVIAQMDLRRRLEELKDALANVKTLRGLLPICAWCKKVRDDTGYWSMVEEYIRTHTDAEFTHGICPECAEKLVKSRKKAP